MLNDFLLGLQFLTRLTVKRDVDWSERACGGSVKFFPLIGAVLGIFYLAAGYIVFWALPERGIELPPYFIGFVLLALNIYLTGALHCDGFTDTMDGILSGRKRERVLEIMKDSHVGAHGTTSLILLLLGKFSMFASLGSATPALSMTALLLLPVIPRLCMAYAVVLFPYARPQGLGKAFHEYSAKKSLIFPSALTFLLCLLGGLPALGALVFACLVMYAFDSYVSQLLGGLTGDVYGATCELGEFMTLFAFAAVSAFIL